MFEGVVWKWHRFRRNFNWGDYYSLLNGRLTAVTSLIPVFGYLVLFNDFLLKNFDFSVLSGSAVRTSLFVDTEQKIRLLFLGSALVFIARLIYLSMRPFVVKQGKDQESYVSFGLEKFTAMDFRRIHERIGASGHNSNYGKYYDDDWDAYYDDSVWSDSGRTDGYDTVRKRDSRSRIHSVEAKRRHEDLLRSMLIDEYIGGSRTRLSYLGCAVFLACFGYLLMLIPTLDLSLLVLQVMLFGH